MTVEQHWENMHSIHKGEDNAPGLRISLTVSSYSSETEDFLKLKLLDLDFYSAPNIP